MIKNYLGEGYFDFGFFGGNTEFRGSSIKNHVQKSPELANLNPVKWYEHV